MSKSERPKIVWIEWLDSNLNHGWLEMESVAREVEHLRCHSVGFIVGENDDVISISTSWDLSKFFVDPLSIPKRSITKIQEDELS
jgi:hypothetical protein